MWTSMKALIREMWYCARPGSSARWPSRKVRKPATRMLTVASAIAAALMGCR